MNLVDTNVLVDFPDIVWTREDLVIPLFIVEELDSLKRMENRELAKRARRASQALKAFREKIVFENETLDSVCAPYADDGLVNLAVKKGYKIITNDINLQLKCEIRKVPYEEYQMTEDGNPTGIRRLYAGKDDKEIASVYENDVSNLTLVNNEYIIIYGEDKKPKDLFKFYDDKLIEIYYSALDKEIYSEYLGKSVKARNIEQACLIDSLFSSSSIVCALGPYGSGKSFLCANYALDQLEKGKINKIVYVPNNSQVEASEEIAALPGELFEKMLPYMGTLVDIVGRESLEQYCMDGTIEILPISVARGRNLDNAIIFVNEAQNLTEDHVKLLIGRVAENSRIFFDGDIKQTDKRIFRDKNGLKLLLRLQESPRFSKLFSVVRLTQTERSETAMAAQFLDELQDVCQGPNLNREMVRF